MSFPFATPKLGIFGVPRFAIVVDELPQVRRVSGIFTPARIGPHVELGVYAGVLIAPCTFAAARKSRGVMPNSRRNALLNVPESEKPHRNAMSVIDARL